MSKKLSTTSWDDLVSYQDRVTYLNGILHEIISPFLSIDGDIPEEISFFELGLTSTTSTSARYELERNLSVNLSSSTLYNYSTLELLQKHLIGQLKLNVDNTEVRNTPAFIGPTTEVNLNIEQYRVKEMLKRRFGI